MRWPLVTTVLMIVIDLALSRPSKNLNNVTETPATATYNEERLVLKYLGKGDKASSPPSSASDNSLGKQSSTTQPPATQFSTRLPTTTLSPTTQTQQPATQPLTTQEPVTISPTTLAPSTQTQSIDLSTKEILADESDDLIPSGSEVSTVEKNSPTEGKETNTESLSDGGVNETTSSGSRGRNDQSNIEVTDNESKMDIKQTNVSEQFIADKELTGAIEPESVVQENSNDAKSTYEGTKTINKNVAADEEKNITDQTINAPDKKMVADKENITNDTPITTTSNSTNNGNKEESDKRKDSENRGRTEIFNEKSDDETTSHTVFKDEANNDYTRDKIEDEDNDEKRDEEESEESDDKIEEDFDMQENSNKNIETHESDDRLERNADHPDSMIDKKSRRMDEENIAPSDTESKPKTESNLKYENEVQAEAEPGDEQVEPKTKSEPELQEDFEGNEEQSSNSIPEPEPEPQLKPDPRPKEEPDSKAELESQTEPKVENEPEPEPESEPKSEADPKPEVKPEATSEATPEPQPTSKPRPKAEAESMKKQKIEPESEPQTHDESRIESEPQTETQPELMPETVITTTAQPDSTIESTTTIKMKGRSDITGHISDDINENIYDTNTEKSDAEKREVKVDMKTQNTYDGSNTNETELNSTEKPDDNFTESIPETTIKSMADDNGNTKNAEEEQNSSLANKNETNGNKTPIVETEDQIGSESEHMETRISPKPSTEEDIDENHDEANIKAVLEMEKAHNASLKNETIKTEDPMTDTPLTDISSNFTNNIFLRSGLTEVNDNETSNDTDNAGYHVESGLSKNEIEVSTSEKPCNCKESPEMKAALDKLDEMQRKHVSWEEKSNKTISVKIDSHNVTDSFIQTSGENDAKEDVKKVLEKEGNQSDTLRQLVNDDFSLNTSAEKLNDKNQSDDATIEKKYHTKQNQINAVNESSEESGESMEYEEDFKILETSQQSESLTIQQTTPKEDSNLNDKHIGAEDKNASTIPVVMKEKNKQNSKEIGTKSERTSDKRHERRITSATALDNESGDVNGLQHESEAGHISNEESEPEFDIEEIVSMSGKKPDIKIQTHTEIKQDETEISNIDTKYKIHEKFNNESNTSPEFLLQTEQKTKANTQTSLPTSLESEIAPTTVKNYEDSTIPNLTAGESVREISDDTISTKTINEDIKGADLSNTNPSMNSDNHHIAEAKGRTSEPLGEQETVEMMTLRDLVMTTMSQMFTEGPATLQPPMEIKEVFIGVTDVPVTTTQETITDKIIHTTANPTTVNLSVQNSTNMTSEHTHDMTTH